MNINIWIIIHVSIILTCIIIAVWQCTKSESYWPNTKYAYTYVNVNGNESDKSPSVTTDLQTGSQKAYIFCHTKWILHDENA
jgi:hypothetical protein